MTQRRARQRLKQEFASILIKDDGVQHVTPSGLVVWSQLPASRPLRKPSNLDDDWEEPPSRTASKNIVLGLAPPHLLGKTHPRTATSRSGRGSAKPLIAPGNASVPQTRAASAIVSSCAPTKTRRGEVKPQTIGFPQRAVLLGHLGSQYKYRRYLQERIARAKALGSGGEGAEDPDDPDDLNSIFHELVVNSGDMRSATPTPRLSNHTSERKEEPANNPPSTVVVPSQSTPSITREEDSTATISTNQPHQSVEANKEFSVEFDESQFPKSRPPTATGSSVYFYEDMTSQYSRNDPSQSTRVIRPFSGVRQTVVHRNVEANQFQDCLSPPMPHLQQKSRNFRLYLGSTLTKAGDKRVGGPAGEPEVYYHISQALRLNPRSMSSSKSSKQSPSHSVKLGPVMYSSNFFSPAIPTKMGQHQGGGLIGHSSHCQTSDLNCSFCSSAHIESF